MSTFPVAFRRSESDGLVSNLWIYHPGNVAEKLIFTNDHAASMLQEGVTYRLFWIMDGHEGDELAVEARVLGKDDDFRAMAASTIPQVPGSPPGARLAWQDYVSFTI
jgi:hypothetical protein